MASQEDIDLATKLVKAGRIPLLTSPPSLTWALMDYLITLEDEIKFVWPGKMNFGKLMFFLIRYYPIALAVFDVAQIHSFSKFYPSLPVCVAMDCIIRVIGAVALWSVEIVMQLRIYVIYHCSKRVALFNGLLFLLSIASFMWILVHNTQRRAAVIADAKKLPIPGCPSIHTGIEWAQWIPATIFEGILFAFALFRSLRTMSIHMRSNRVLRHSLWTVVLQDNLLYFFGVSILLVLNNLMVVSTVSHIPWFSYGPFHVAMGIMTSRMLLHLYKAAARGRVVYSDTNKSGMYARYAFEGDEGDASATLTDIGYAANYTSDHTTVVDVTRSTDVECQLPDALKNTDSIELKTIKLQNEYVK